MNNYNTRMATLAVSLALAGCGAGEDAQSVLQSDLPADVTVSAEVPARIVALGNDLQVQASVNGTIQNLLSSNGTAYSATLNINFNIEQQIYLSIRRASDNTLLGIANQQLLLSSSSNAAHFPDYIFDIDYDTDGDGFSNLYELEQGSDPNSRNGDFDNDGLADNIDPDDDNDGVPDERDPLPYDASETMDTDLDGIGNNRDVDDDNDGVNDGNDAFPLDPTETLDTDGDGIGNNRDPDDDNDGVEDALDPEPLIASLSIDTDGDGIPDAIDPDDDNDGVLDANDDFPTNSMETNDNDNDGIGDNADPDDDNDSMPDQSDPQPMNSAVTGREDTDMDGHPDFDDLFPYDASEFADQDLDGIGNNADPDDDGDGIPDSQEDAIAVIPRVVRTPTLDGVFAWDEWAGAVRCDSRGNYLAVNHLLIDNQGDEQDLINEWGGTDWRAMHDGRYLYILVRVDNEPFYERFNDSINPWEDDSIEVYLDVGNERATEYDNNDYQYVVSFVPGASQLGSQSATGMQISHSTSAWGGLQEGVVSTYEIRIDMSSIGLRTERFFGFEIHINDDDNGGTRDSKWGWASPSSNQNAWRDPSLFGKAILAPGRFAAD